jgi:hypothetical protein
MSCSDKKFWLEIPGALFTSIQVFPHRNMNLAEQLNAITRVILIIGIIMWLFNFQYGPHFLIISLVFIIIIYYIQRNTMQRCQENYEFPVRNETCPRQNVYSLQPYKSTAIVNESRTVAGNGTQTAKLTFTTGDPLPFCNDEISIDPPDPFAVGLNQSLAVYTDPYGNKIHELPTARIKPVVVPPAYDLESWRDNNLITYSTINSPGVQQDMYLSGYAESSCCGYIGNGTELVPRPGQKIPTVVGGTIPEVLVENFRHEPIRENYRPGAVVSPVPVTERPYIPTTPIRENYRPGAVVSPVPVTEKPYIPTTPIRENYRPGAVVSPVPVTEKPYIPTTPIRENYCLETGNDNKPINVQPNRSGWVNTACGYNPDQVQVGLPSNFPAGNCDQDPKMAQYNRNMFTQIVTPGVYSFNEVNEPINSNIGISFTQQFEPVTAKRDDDGLKFTLHDPRIIEPAFESPSESIKAKYDNVYDPRFYGYGTSYRSYLEPVTGQTRFMYEDVNAIRMPNYVVRSKIDHLAYADHYGPMEPGSEYGNVLNPNIRALAQDSWLRDSMTFREDLTQRLMRKVNAEGWQKRMYPNSSRPVGSGRRIQ